MQELKGSGQNERLPASVSQVDPIIATYLVESPLPLQEVAQHLCAESSTGSFIGLPRETAELQARHRAVPLSLEILGTRPAPSLPSRRFPSSADGPFNWGIVKIAFPFENIGSSIPAMLAAVAGNIFELSVHTGLRLVDIDMPLGFASRYPGPQFGVQGTRRLMKSDGGVLVGTIVKPSVGLSIDEHRVVVRELIEGGVDFIKDDELVANPPYLPLRDRVRVVMEEVDRGERRLGRRVMYAFNITDEVDEMLDHHDFVVDAGGNCVMVTMAAVGLAAVARIARHATVPIHGHRAMVAASMRHPGLGIDYRVYQKFARMVGVDHLHVSGLKSKFYEEDEEVGASFDAVREPIFGGYHALPVISSGQWAGTVPATAQRTQTQDLMMLAGAGIHSHPGGLADGVTSIRAAWDAVSAGKSLEEYAATNGPLRAALNTFGASGG